jgi:hypothetical protein
VSFCFPFLFSLLFLLSPFVFLGFCTLSYIYACTLDYSRRLYREISFPFVFTPRAHSAHLHFVAFHSAHVGATLCNIPVTPSPSWNPTRNLRAPLHLRPPLFVLFWARPVVCQRITECISSHVSPTRVHERTMTFLVLFIEGQRSAWDGPTSGTTHRTIG